MTPQNLLICTAQIRDIKYCQKWSTIIAWSATYLPGHTWIKPCKCMQQLYKDIFLPKHLRLSSTLQLKKHLILHTWHSSESYYVLNVSTGGDPDHHLRSQPLGTTQQAKRWTLSTSSSFWAVAPLWPWAALLWVSRGPARCRLQRVGIADCSRRHSLAEQSLGMGTSGQNSNEMLVN